MSVEAPRGVLVCGAYGTGKSSVCEEIATILERAVRPYAAIDLDWLAWFDAGRDEATNDRVALDNIRAVVGNYLDAGVRYVVLAGWVGHDAELADLRSVLPFELMVVELRAPWAEVERRLLSSPTVGRLDDLEEARRQFASSGPGPTVDAVVDADRSVSEVAEEVLGLLGWLH